MPQPPSSPTPISPPPPTPGPILPASCPMPFTTCQSPSTPKSRARPAWVHTGLRAESDSTLAPELLGPTPPQGSAMAPVPEGPPSGLAVSPSPRPARPASLLGRPHPSAGPEARLHCTRDLRLRWSLRGLPSPRLRGSLSHLPTEQRSSGQGPRGTVRPSSQGCGEPPLRAQPLQRLRGGGPLRAQLSLLPPPPLPMPPGKRIASLGPPGTDLHLPVHGAVILTSLPLGCQVKN